MITPPSPPDSTALPHPLAMRFTPWIAPDGKSNQKLAVPPKPSQQATTVTKTGAEVPLLASASSALEGGTFLRLRTQSQGEEVESSDGGRRSAGSSKAILQIQKVRNRESAKRSRQNFRERLGFLERRNAQLEEENKRLYEVLMGMARN
mmetsp:Transcript_3200/g.8333  ORF Transcript_3200/g.8333 Transcript_3200/m.8333 type:complete len:149 (-) Transcript_3200:44-490(-)